MCAVYMYTMDKEDHVVRVCILINGTFPWGVWPKLQPVMTSCRIGLLSEFDIKHNHHTGDIIQHYPFLRRLNKGEQKEVKKIVALK